MIAVEKRLLGYACWLGAGFVRWSELVSENFGPTTRRYWESAYRAAQADQRVDTVSVAEGAGGGVGFLSECVMATDLEHRSSEAVIRADIRLLKTTGMWS